MTTSRAPFEQADGDGVFGRLADGQVCGKQASERALMQG
jgi:hypothetical protein